MSSFEFSIGDLIYHKARWMKEKGAAFHIVPVDGPHTQGWTFHDFGHRIYLVVGYHRYEETGYPPHDYWCLLTPEAQLIWVDENERLDVVDA